MKRVAYAGLFLASAGFAIAISGFGVWQLWFFALAPDLTFLIAGGPALAKGQIHPRAVPFYNAAHSLLGPALVALVVLALTGPGPWLTGALGWMAHISADRALGFGPRAHTGFQRYASSLPR